MAGLTRLCFLTAVLGGLLYIADEAEGSGNTGSCKPPETILSQLDTNIGRSTPRNPHCSLMRYIELSNN